MLGLVGCQGTSPVGSTPVFVFTAPVTGQTLRVGDTAVVSWSCDCEGYSFVVRAFAQNGGNVDVSPRITGRSFSWVAGTTDDSLTLLPGSYQLWLVAFVSDGHSLNPYHEIRGPAINLVQ